MPGPDQPVGPPPEVPEEFAAAYREAYLRALAEDGVGPEVDSATEPGVDPGVSSEVSSEVSSGAERGVAGGVESDAAPADLAAEPGGAAAGGRSQRWVLPAAAVAVVFLLVLGAYAVGTAISGDDEPDRADARRTSAPSATADRTPSADASERPTRKPSLAENAFEGEVAAVTASAVSADCKAAPGRDAAGRPVTYDPEQAIDGDPSTAWRCGGRAIGERLTLRLPGDVDVAEVGLVPGYAKTDPDNGADRYAENNRITRVRWRLGDGVSVVQRLDPDPSLREVQRIRVPRTTTDTITLEVLAVRPGPRNTTAISEIVIATAE